jgi:hypothetical protein
MDVLEELHSRIMKLPEEARPEALSHLECFYRPNSKSNLWLTHLVSLVQLLQKHGV